MSVTKEYTRALRNQRLSWIAFDKINDKTQGQSPEVIREVENSKEYKKSLARFQKWYRELNIQCFKSVSE